MYTIHDSRDMGCPVRGFVDDRDPAAAHRSAAALGIPEAHRIILSEPRITVDEARRGALDARQLRLDARQLRLDLDAEREEHEGTREVLREEEKRAKDARESLGTLRKELEEIKARNGLLAAEVTKRAPTLPSVHTTEPAYADGVR